MDAIYNMLGSAAAASMLQESINLKGSGTKPNSSTDSDFQKLMEKAKPDQPDSETPERAEAEKTDGAAEKEGPIQKKEEDPVETIKRMQVYLAPISPEELSQYPAEWIPQVQEGEPIVCVGVTTGEDGQQMPILMSANEAFQKYGFRVAAPEVTVQQPQGEIEIPEEMVQAPEEMERTEQTVEAEPAPAEAEELPEIRPAVQKADQPREENSVEVEVTDSEQAPQRIFHDVKAAPIKVGEAYDAPKTEQADVAGQIDSKLAQALEQGDPYVRIQLDPESLGQVTVEISQSSDGALRVALTAHSSETRNLLERHSTDLQGLLSSRTQQNVQVEVQRQQESQQGQDRHPYDGHNGHAQEQSGQQQRQHREERDSQDFMQQLRLGLIPAEAEEI